MNTIISPHRSSRRRPRSDYDEAMRVISDIMLQPTWISAPVPWWTKNAATSGSEEYDSGSDIDFDFDSSIITVTAVTTTTRLPTIIEEDSVLIGESQDDSEGAGDISSIISCYLESIGPPPSIPLPPLPAAPSLFNFPTLPPVQPAPAHDEQEGPRRLKGEALQNVMNFMNKSVRIAKERRRNRGQQFEN